MCDTCRTLSYQEAFPVVSRARLRGLRSQIGRLFESVRDALQMLCGELQVCGLGVRSGRPKRQPLANGHLGFLVRIHLMHLAHFDAF